MSRAGPSSLRASRGEGARLVQPVSASAASMSSTPAPTAMGSPAILRAERISRALTDAGFRLGSCEIISAAAPETMAAAMLVPDSSR